MHPLIPIAVAAALLMGCETHRKVASEQSRIGIFDFTVRQPAVCEVHGVTMSAKVVELEFGMKAMTETDKARQQLFPHADEPYNTGYCIPLVERRGRVFVCPRCTKARTGWLSAHKPGPR